MNTGADYEARFWQHVDTSGDCWLWTGGVHKEGYGRFHVDKRVRSAHRYAYEISHGPIPDGAAIIRSCAHPLCVNPAHLAQSDRKHYGQSLQEHILSRSTIRPDGCWQWHGVILDNGYGRACSTHLDTHRHQTSAHRASYMAFVGPIPDGLQLDHLCRNTLCVNPAHLEPVTHRENNVRKPGTHKSHCVHGHEMTEANTIFKPRPNGVSRVCRTCKRITDRAIPRAGWRKRRADKAAGSDAPSPRRDVSAPPPNQ